MPADRLGREACAELSVAERCEWRVTNGIGGYASGTAAGHSTRGFQGLLVAALDPPLGLSLKLITGHHDYHGHSVAGGETPAASAPVGTDVRIFRIVLLKIRNLHNAPLHLT